MGSPPVFLFLPFFFSRLSFAVTCKKSWLNPKSQRFSPVLSSKVFLVCVFQEIVCFVKVVRCIFWQTAVNRVLLKCFPFLRHFSRRLLFLFRFWSSVFSPDTWSLQLQLCPFCLSSQRTNIWFLFFFNVFYFVDFHCKLFPPFCSLWAWVFFLFIVS